MTYSINGVPLDNPGFGWLFRAPSKPLSQIVKEANSVIVPGVDGATALPSTVRPVTLRLMVQTPRVHLETLYALMLSPTLALSLTGLPGKSLDVEYLSPTLDGYGDADAIVDAEFLVRANHPFWRADTDVTSDSVAVGSASVVVAVLPGMSAPVSDALIRVKGSISSLRVTDSGGSWFSYTGTVPADRWLMVVPEQNLARLQSVEGSWDDYDSDVSGNLDFWGPRGVFEITPHFTTDPSARSGVLTVTSTARSGASIQVRGRSAHVVV